MENSSPMRLCRQKNKTTITRDHRYTTPYFKHSLSKKNHIHACSMPIRIHRRPPVIYSLLL